MAVRRTFSGGKPLAKSDASARPPTSSARRKGPFSIAPQCTRFARFSVVQVLGSAAQRTPIGEIAHTAISNRHVDDLLGPMAKGGTMNNVETVRSVYDNFSKQNVPAILECL